MFKEKISEYCFFNNEVKKFNEVDLKSFEDSDEIVYEVIRVINGKPLFWKEHIDRIYLSFEKLGIKLEISRETFKDGAKEIVEVDQMLNNNIKILVGKFSDHIKFLIYNIKSNYPNEETKKNGVKVKAFRYERLNPGAKVINLSYKKEVYKFIKNEDIFEAVLVDNNEFVTEGSRSNLFFIKDDVIYTSKANAVLLGITRMKLLELFESLNLKVCELDIKLSSLDTYDGAFLSGTSINALAIDRVGDYVYSSSDNKTYRLIRSSFEKMLLENTYW